MRNAVALALLLIATVACSPERSKQVDKPLSEPGETIYAVRGVILGRDAGDNTLRLDHEAIPGYMEAMAMDYPVRGVTVASLPPDKARVEGKLHVHGDTIWLTDVKQVR